MTNMFAAVTLIWAVPASTAELVYTGNFSNISSGNLPQFNPSLGTLLSLRMEQTFTFTGSEAATFYGEPGPTSFSLSFYGLASTEFGGVEFSETYVIELPASQLIFPGGSASASSDAQFTGDLTRLVGTDVYQFGPRSSPFLHVTQISGPPVSFYPSDPRRRHLAGSFRATYSYLEVGAVPEPVSWMIMIVGFALVGGQMRRGLQRPNQINARPLTS